MGYWLSTATVSVVLGLTEIGLTEIGSTEIGFTETVSLEDTGFMDV